MCDGVVLLQYYSSSGLHIRALYGFPCNPHKASVSRNTRDGTAQVSSLSCTKLLTLYAALDFLLSLTQTTNKQQFNTNNRASASWVKHLLHLPFPLGNLGGSPVLCEWSREHKLWADAKPNEKFHSCFLWEHSWFCVVQMSLAVLTVATYELSFINS